MQATEVLAETARRITADLGTRFPGIQLALTCTPDGLVSVEVNEWGGSVGFDWFPDGPDENDYDRVDVERFVETVAFHVADNLWPDELTDPWPVCPQHRDHPLVVGVHLGLAAWVCPRDPTTAIPVGDLPNA